MVQNAMSATEFYILKYLWSRETPATFSKIMTHFNEEEKKEWKKQTVNTFLTRLAQKGFLNIDKSGKRAIYIPSVSRKIIIFICILIKYNIFTYTIKFFFIDKILIHLFPHSQFLKFANSI